MLGSVYQNGGFWIGRYEATSDSPRIDKNQTLTEVRIQRNLYPYTYVTCPQAQMQAAALSTGKSYTTSLVFGLQWSLTVQFMIEKDNTIQRISQGNSNGEEFSVTNTSTKYSEDGGKTYEPVIGTYVRLAADYPIFTAAATDRNMCMNIYDMRGNVFEWTLGKERQIGTPCFSVGGDTYNSSGILEGLIGSTGQTGQSVGFRVSLYK